MVGQTSVYKDIKYYHFIYVILQGFRDRIQSIEGLVKGVS
jgi:hypothetical protein